MEHSPSQEDIRFCNCSDLNLSLFPHAPTGSAFSPVAVTATNPSLILTSSWSCVYTGTGTAWLLLSKMIHMHYVNVRGD